MRILLSLAAFTMAGTASLISSPAMAQTQDRIIDIYGDEKCPASNGQEIVVCKHHPIGEKYRIPKDLREQEAAPQALGGTTVAAVNSTGGTGVQVNSCNAIGAGTAVGCLKKETNNWKADQHAQKKDEEGIP